MGQVVLDSHNLEAVVQDATGEPLQAEEKAEKVPDKPVEASEDTGKAKPQGEDPDDIEGEDGLTAHQKKELTLKMQAAIGKKHRAAKEAEEFATEQYNERRLAEQRAEGLERELNRLKAQVPEKAKELTEPKRDDFKTDLEYIDARADYRAEIKFREMQAQAQKAQEEQKRQETLARASERIAKAIELVPDFEEVTGSVDVEVPPVIAAYMQRSLMFAELGYHFAQHPSELERLRLLPPDEALVEVGEIKSRLKPFSASDGSEPEKANGEKPSKPNTVTDASPSQPRAPIKPLSSGTVSQVESDPHKRTYAEEKAIWQKKHSVNLNRRQRH
jgi:hypothetical protein